MRGSTVAKSIAGILVLAMLLAADVRTARAHGDDDGDDGGGGSTAQTIKFYPIGNGQGFDDKSGVGCDITKYPDLACSFTGSDQDFCGCLSIDTTSPPAFSGTGLCKGSTLSNFVISFDIDNQTGPNGIPDGSNTTPAPPPPIAGRCYGGSGFATIATNDGNGDTINLLLQGVFCDSIPGQAASNASFSGSYIVEGGTGPYASATGTGSFTASIDNVNSLPSPSPMTFSATGSLTALSGVSGSSCSGLNSDGDADENGDSHSNNHHGHGKG